MSENNNHQEECWTQSKSSKNTTNMVILDRIKTIWLMNMLCKYKETGMCYTLTKKDADEWKQHIGSK